MHGIIQKDISFDISTLPRNVMVFQNKSDRMFLQMWSTVCLVNDVVMYLFTKILEDLPILAPLDLKKFCQIRFSSICENYKLIGFLTKEWVEGQKKMILLYPPKNPVFGTAHNTKIIALFDHWVSKLETGSDGFWNRFSLIKYFIKT